MQAQDIKAGLFYSPISNPWLTERTKLHTVMKYENIIHDITSENSAYSTARFFFLP